MVPRMFVNALRDPNTMNLFCFVFVATQILLGIGLVASASHQARTADSSHDQEGHILFVLLSLCHCCFEAAHFPLA